MRRRALLGNDSGQYLPDSVIHHFPLDIVSELNDIINSGFIVPNATFADSVQWDRIRRKYVQFNLQNCTI